MRRRHDAYAEIKQRLDEWGDYRRNIAHIIGWNVNVMDFDGVRGIQKRNDTHSDPVAQEVGRMVGEQKRHMTTDTAVTELRPKWLRKLIVARHSRWPDISERQLAAKLRFNHRLIGNNLSIGYEILEEKIAALDRQRFGFTADRNRVAFVRQTG